MVFDPSGFSDGTRTAGGLVDIIVGMSVPMVVGSDVTVFGAVVADRCGDLDGCAIGNEKDGRFVGKSVIVFVGTSVTLIVGSDVSVAGALVIDASGLLLDTTVGTPTGSFSIDGDSVTGLVGVSVPNIVGSDVAETGTLVFDSRGKLVGKKVGTFIVGNFVAGMPVIDSVGASVTIIVGSVVIVIGNLVGSPFGLFNGPKFGPRIGIAVGDSKGALIGDRCGMFVGLTVGALTEGTCATGKLVIENAGNSLPPNVGTDVAEAGFFVANLLGCLEGCEFGLLTGGSKDTGSCGEFVLAIIGADVTVVCRAGALVDDPCGILDEFTFGASTGDSEGIFVFRLGSEGELVGDSVFILCIVGSGLSVGDSNTFDGKRELIGRKNGDDFAGIVGLVVAVGPRVMGIEVGMRVIRGSDGSLIGTNATGNCVRVIGVFTGTFIPAGVDVASLCGAATGRFVGCLVDRAIVGDWPNGAEMDGFGVTTDVETGASSIGVTIKLTVGASVAMITLGTLVDMMTLAGATETILLNGMLIGIGWLVA